MTSHFVEADAASIEELKHGSENKNTRRRTVYWTGIFKQWAFERVRNEQKWKMLMQGVQKLLFLLIKYANLWRSRCGIAVAVPNTFWAFLMFAATIYCCWSRVTLENKMNGMKPCNVVNCILRIECSLNLLVTYVCFDLWRQGFIARTSCVIAIPSKSFALYVINK